MGREVTINLAWLRLYGFDSSAFMVSLKAHLKALGVDADPRLVEGVLQDPLCVTENEYDEEAIQHFFEAYP